MGCCFSRPVGINAPYPGGPASGSARAINSPRLRSAPDDNAAASRAPSQLQPQLQPQARQTRRRHRHSQQPLSQHVDRPLRKHDWVATGRTWTPAALARERAEYFDTRVTGRAEVWQTLRAALELTWEAVALSRAAGHDRGGLNATALATAQSILTAAEITLPTGDLANGAYDFLGNCYPLPEWVVSDPVNIAVSDQAEEQDAKDKDGDTAVDEEAGDDEVMRRREEKGKAIADARDTLKVCVRLSENSRDIILQIGQDETVRSFARKIREEAGLHGDKIIRVAYMGKLLKENLSLLAQGWTQGHTVNAFIFNKSSL